MKSAFLEMKSICKRYGGTQALDSADMSVRGGEVHALLGENGAGKSTLMKVLVGAVKKDSGRILIDGKQVEIHSVTEARGLGIAEIYQELRSLSLALNASILSFGLAVIHFTTLPA